MEWQAAQEAWKNDEWLRHVLFSRDNRYWADEGFQYRWVEDCLSYIRFLPFEGLNPDWRDSNSHMMVRSSLYPTPFNEHLDVVGHSMVHHLVCQLSMPEQLVVMTLSNGSRAKGSTSIRWQTINRHRRFSQHSGDCQREVRWIAAVRNISLISQGEYVMNGYEAYRFPAGFNPFNAGWSVKG